MKDIIEILKYAPRGLKLYTATMGTVEFMKVNQRGEIVTFGGNGTTIEAFDRFGRKHPNGECLLFPDCDHRDWDFIWQPILFRKGDFITTKNGTRIITDLENRRCVSPVGDTINFIIDRDTTRWASPSEVSDFMESLEIHGYLWDEVNLSVKPTQKMSKELAETYEFEKSLTEDLECYHKMKEQGVGKDALKEWIYCWRNTLLGIAKNLYVKEDDSETRTPESESRTQDSENQCITVDDSFLKPDEELMWKKSGEIARYIVENQCGLDEETVSATLMDMSNLTRNCVLAELEDFLTNRIEELQEIKSREEGHGITSTDMMSVTGGMQEIQILLEKLRTSK